MNFSDLEARLTVPRVLWMIVYAWLPDWMRRT